MSNLGRARASVTCPCCREVNTFYLWSWAGNGCARCKHCGAKIDYRTEKVLEGCP